MRIVRILPILGYVLIVSIELVHALVSLVVVSEKNRQGLSVLVLVLNYRNVSVLSKKLHVVLGSFFMEFLITWLSVEIKLSFRLYLCFVHGVLIYILGV